MSKAWSFITPLQPPALFVHPRQTHTVNLQDFSASVRGKHLKRGKRMEYSLANAREKKPCGVFLTGTRCFWTLCRMTACLHTALGALVSHWSMCNCLDLCKSRYCSPIAHDNVLPPLFHEWKQRHGHLLGRNWVCWKPTFKHSGSFACSATNIWDSACFLSSTLHKDLGQVYLRADLDRFGPSLLKFMIFTEISL